MGKSHLTFVLVLAALSGVAGEAWVTEGFEAFRRGTFGNAGQNLYVSKAGVLQRIYQFDLDKNGWLDLVYANCQDHHESAPSYVYDVAGGKRLSTLAAQGSRSGAVADLNGDGIPDVVVTGFFDMVTPFSPAEIYYGQPDGTYSDRYHVRIQAPHAVDTAVGRFDGSAKPALAFAIPEHKLLRIYTQTDIGFEWREFKDIASENDVIAAADFDGDGFDDLAARKSDETTTVIWWGGKDGLAADRKTEFPGVPSSDCLSAAEAEGMQSELEKKFVAPRLLEAVDFGGRKCFTLSTGKKVILFSVTRERTVSRELELELPMALSVATGDFNEDGLTDVAVASQVADPTDRKKQTSWIWINSKEGFRKENLITLNTRSACHVDALGRQVVFGQCAAGGCYTNDALLFEFREGRFDPEPKRFEGEDTRRAILFRGAKGDVKLYLVNHYARRSNGYDRSYVYWGREGGKYDPKDMTEVPSWCAVSAHAVDFDDDGWAELLVDNNSENSLDQDPGHHVHHFGPKGFEPERSYCIPTDIGWGSTVADFDRDGWLDVITVADHWNTLAFFKGGPDGLKRVKDYVVVPKTDANEVPTAKKQNGQGILDASRPLKREKAGGLRWPIAVDVNGDGWLDLASPFGARATIYFGGPDGFDLDRRQEVAGYSACGVRAADLDKDGRPEIIFGGHCSQPRGNDFYRQPHHSYLHVYWNGANGLDDSRKCILRADAASHLCVADLDGNGWLDIFACSYQGDVDRDINSFIYWNRGGNFEQFDRQDLITHATSGCIAADFNEDGRIDLAVANHKIYGDHKGYSEVWWNTDEGFLPSRTTKLPTCGPHGMYVIEPGNILDRGASEYYISEPYVAEKDLTVTSAKIDAEVPPKCWVKILLRVNGGDWKEPSGLVAKKGDELQYRLELGAFNSLQTPRVTRVSVALSDGRSRIERAIAEMDARNAAAEKSFGGELSVTSRADKVRCVNGTNVWTDAINAALRDSQVVRIPASRTPYYVDGTIIVPSCRKIVAEGATISLLPPCDTVLLRNANAADGTLKPIDRSTGDRNICIVGGRWEDWQVSRKGYGRSGRFNDGVREKGRNFYGVSALLYFGNVETLTVRDITVANAGGFAIQCGDARDVLFRNIEFDGCFADGLHLNGGVERVHAQNIRGDVGDDLVALNVYDWQNSSVNFGPGDTILCEDLCLRSGYPAIRLLPGVYRFADGSKQDCSLNNVLLRNVRGVNCFKMYLQTPAYGIGTDPEWGEVGSAENLWFENVDIDLDFPPDRLEPYLTGDPVRGHFGAFEIGANVKGLNLVNVRANLHADTYPLAHLVCAGPKSCVMKGKDGQPVELFDPWVSCLLDGVAIDGFKAVGRRPDELLHATVFEDVNHDGRSTGRGEIRGVEVR